jgi:hypothetical protein
MTLISSLLQIFWPELVLPSCMTALSTGSIYTANEPSPDRQAPAFFWGKIEENLDAYA